MNRKLNCHLLEACNFRCKHCFAAFRPPRLLTFDEWWGIIAGLPPDFTAVNFAGGEPLMYSDIEKLVRFTAERGLKTSIISNGSAAIDRYVALAPYLDTLGISVDSVNPEISRAVGRCDRSGRVLTFDGLFQLVSAVRAANPRIEIKINTVVSRPNKDDARQMADVCLALGVNRWKILKCKRFVCEGFDNKLCCVSDEEFDAYAASALDSFCMRHQPGQVLYRDRYIDIVVEEKLAGSYYFVDPAGLLLDNSEGDCHRPVADLTVDDWETALSRLNFDAELFSARYGG